MAPSPIDVIIPIHNQPDLVAQCITSILEARCAVGYEIIAIDDASTDSRVKHHLASLKDAGKITLITNPHNLGFTRTVNLGMKLHRDRDVVLLNSDTIVYDGWLDRMVAAAGDGVASVNPLTNQRGSHISCYPLLSGVSSRELEVDDATLNRLAGERNAGKHVEVHTTVGFCMFIRRACLNDIGYFDSVNFPVAYGEESDFCYRARKAGWRHRVAGDVFITHLEGQSFSERKAKLMAEMLVKFSHLHPEVAILDAAFRRQDPVRALRRGLDIGRIQLLLGGTHTLAVSLETDEAPEPGTGLHGVYSADAGRFSFRLDDAVDAFPNVGDFAFPGDLASFNHVMRMLGVTELRCSPDGERVLVQASRGLEGEVSLGAALTVA